MFDRYLYLQFLILLLSILTAADRLLIVVCKIRQLQVVADYEWTSPLFWAIVLPYLVCRVSLLCYFACQYCTIIKFKPDSLKEPEDVISEMQMQGGFCILDRMSQNRLWHRTHTHTSSLWQLWICSAGAYWQCVLVVSGCTLVCFLYQNDRSFESEHWSNSHKLQKY